MTSILHKYVHGTLRGSRGTWHAGPEPAPPVIEWLRVVTVARWRSRLFGRGDRLFRRMAHTWLPERTCNLPNSDLKLGDVELAVQAMTDLVFGGRLEEQFQRLAQVVTYLFDRVSLAGDVQIGAQRNVAITLALNNFLPPCHAPQNSGTLGC